MDDAVAAKELALSDSEHSDAEVSFTDNGTFNLSRGQTPLTEGSEGQYWPTVHIKAPLILPASSPSLLTSFLSAQILTDTVMPRSRLLKTSPTSPQ